MDGVLIDVSRSYRDTVRQTATLFLKPAVGADRLPRPLFDLADLAVVKQSGGLNNDWDLTHRVLSLLYTKITPVDEAPHSSGWLSYESTISKCDVGPLADFLKRTDRPLQKLMQSSSQPRIRFIDQMYRGDVGSGNIIKQIFQEIYLGRTLFEQTYASPCKMSSEEGFIFRETLFPDLDQLEMLSRENLLAIATGRPRAEAEHPLERFELAEYFQPVLTLDDCLKEEKRLRENTGEEVSLGKPHPYMLDAVAEQVRTPVGKRIYVGDMPDDMQAASRSEFGYMGIGMTISAGNKIALGQRLRQTGAAQVVADFAELQKFLDEMH